MFAVKRTDDEDLCEALIDNQMNNATPQMEGHAAATFITNA